MKNLALALVATLVTSMAFAAPQHPGQPGPDPGRPEPTKPLPAPPGHRPVPQPQPPARPMPPPQRPDEIVRLGGTRLSPITDADTIQVNSCDSSEIGRISEVRITAMKHSARIQGIRVTYGNLSSDDIAVNKNLSPGQSTRWIDLAGPGGRGVCVRTIRVFGASRSIGFKQAEIDIYGRRQFRTELDLQDRREEN